MPNTSLKPKSDHKSRKDDEKLTKSKPKSSHKRSHSSSDSSPSPFREKKRVKKSKKKKSRSSSSDSDERERKKRKKAKKKAKKMMKELRKLQKKKEKAKEKDDSEEVCNDVPLDLMDKAKAMVPMTKEEWEKKQSVIRRVYDEESGRHRLIKGDGEVIEEIVSRDRHKSINKQATQGDGNFFQAKINSNLKK